MTQLRIDLQGFFAFVFLVLILKTAAQEYGFIVQHEGQSVAIAMYGEHIYFNSGGNLHIVEMGPENSFTRINKLHTPAISGLDVDQGRLFVSAENVQIYDLQNPDEPQLIGQTEGGSFESVIVEGSMLIANAGESVVLYDISEPSHPEYLSSIKFTFNGNGAYAYKEPVIYGFSQPAYSGPQFILGYDISDPFNPVLTTFIETSSSWTTPWADAMAVNDDFLLVGSDDKLRFYDISNPDTIIYMSAFSIPGETGKISWDGDLAWVSANPGGLLLYDLSELSNPLHLGTYDLLYEIADFHIGEEIAGCALSNHGFRLLDVSNLPVMKTVWQYDGTNAVWSICLDQSIGYFGMVPSGLRIEDLSNIFLPEIQGSLPSLPRLNTIRKNGDYLYTMEDGDSTMYVVDVSNPSQLQVTEEIKSDNGFISDFDVSGTSLFLIDHYTQLKKYYLYPPGVPSLVKTWNDTLSCLAFQDNHLVIATPDYWPGGSEFSLELYTTLENHDIVLNDQCLLGSMLTYRPRQMILNYPYLFVRVHGGVVVYFISEEKSLALCDAYWVGSGYTNAMTLNADSIFLGTTEGTLVLQKTDPYNLELVQTIAVSASGMCVRDNLLFFTRAAHGYSIYGHDVVGIHDRVVGNQESTLYCYPNPADDIVIFQHSIPEGQTALLRIIDIYGRQIVVQEVLDKEKTIIPTHSLNQGIYFPVLEYSGPRITGKFIISR